MADGGRRLYEVGSRPRLGQQWTVAFENGPLVEWRITRTVRHETALRIWALRICSSVIWLAVPEALAQCPGNCG